MNSLQESSSNSIAISTGQHWYKLSHEHDKSKQNPVKKRRPKQNRLSLPCFVSVRGSDRSEPQLRAEPELVAIIDVERRREVEVERRARARERPDRGGVVAIVHDGGRRRAVAVAVGVGGRGLPQGPRLRSSTPAMHRRWRRPGHSGAGPAGGLDGGAGAARGRGHGRGRAGGERGEVVGGEVGPGERAAQGARGHVVGARRGLGGVEGAEPDARALRRVPDLRRKPTPRPLPHAPVPRRRCSSHRRVAHRAPFIYLLLSSLYTTESKALVGAGLRSLSIGREAGSTRQGAEERGREGLGLGYGEEGAVLVWSGRRGRRDGG